MFFAASTGDSCANRNNPFSYNNITYFPISRRTSYC